MLQNGRVLFLINVNDSYVGGYYSVLLLMYIMQFWWSTYIGKGFLFLFEVGSTVMVQQ